MRIALLAYNFHPTLGAGSASYIRDLIKSFSEKKNIEIFLFTKNYDRGNHLDTFFNQRVYKTDLNFPNVLKDFELGMKWLSFADVIKKENIELVHAQDLFGGFLGHKLKRKFDLPFVYVKEVVTNKIPSIYTRFFRYNTERLLTKTLDFDVLVSWSNFMVDYFLSWGIDPEKIKVIPGGVDTKIFNPHAKFRNIRKMYGINESDTLFLSVKGMSKSNTLGLIRSIKAFRILLKKFPKIKYIIIGDGWGKKLLARLTKNLNLEKNVMLPGWIDRRFLPDYYLSSDITLHYFAYEASISISLLESLACGKPIVTTNVGEIPYTVNDKVGLISNPENLSEFADSMEILLTDEKLRKKMSRNAWKLAKTKFEIDVIRDQYLKLYNKLI
jgi:glycosyltransferase involved in cell wall biosynthesis